MQVRGSELLTDIFGFWPSFHDAEVVRIALERTLPFEDGPHLLADIHTFEMTKEVDSDGYHILRHHVVVSFRFGGVDQLQLEGFNNQNVVFGLSIEPIDEGQNDGFRYEVKFEASYGIGANFMCRDVCIETVRPWTPD
ncbi:MAG: hypothetical protein AMXMBFR82_52640 [Candidatus Hydrogenedentota bacterium]